jgi:acetyl-CoA carboxylase carboxyltransferase component
MRLEAKNRAANGDTEAANWLKEQEALLSQRYEAELMNPKEALSLGSISQIVMPQDLRQTLGENFIRYIKAYQPKPMTAIQREFH